MRTRVLSWVNTAMGIPGGQRLGVGEVAEPGHLDRRELRQAGHPVAQLAVLAAAPGPYRPVGAERQAVLDAGRHRGYPGQSHYLDRCVLLVLGSVAKLSCEGPQPRSPSSLRPQAHTAPSVRNARPWSFPAATCTISRLNPLTGPNSVLLALVPLPSWPSLLTPQLATPFWPKTGDFTRAWASAVCETPAAPARPNISAAQPASRASRDLCRTPHVYSPPSHRPSRRQTETLSGYVRSGAGLVHRRVRPLAVRQTR